MVAEENFLRRWSRRKHERDAQERGDGAPPAPPEPAQAPAQPGTLPGPQAAAPAAPTPIPAELPPVDSLDGLASDYEAFLNPAVDESLRRSALKKLFHDPHFNVMDGLDVYIDDYSKPDPVPESMLKELLARHRTFTERPEQDAATRAAPGAIADAGDAGAPAPEPRPAVEVPAAGQDPEPPLTQDPKPS
jgi:uncharacterized protein DUF3306